MEVQIIEKFKKVLGQEHPTTLASNIASTYRNQGAMEGGRRADCAGHGDEKEGTWPRASRHLDLHDPPRIEARAPKSRKSRSRGRSRGCSANSI